MKLNNKGFTLVELLAVVVIISVIIGIAIISVISAINKSKASALENSAKEIAKAFQSEYLSNLLKGNPTNLYQQGNFSGYNFSATDNVIAFRRQSGDWSSYHESSWYDFEKTNLSTEHSYYLTETIADKLGLSKSDYKLHFKIAYTGNDTESDDAYQHICYNNKDSSKICNDDENITELPLKTSYNVDIDIINSFVYFQTSTGKFTVCLFANENGNLYVPKYAYKSRKKIFKNISDSFVADAKIGQMFACSDGTNSWSD